VGETGHGGKSDKRSVGGGGKIRVA
jgi:hypothetical protein